MDYRYLGRSALKVSPLCLGTMMFGQQTPDDEAFRIIDKARERGVNFIDTADVYDGGQSERVVGQGIRAQRDHWVLATKFVNRNGDGPNQGGYSRKWVMETVDNSLRRLGTDYIDLYQTHSPDKDTPLDETLAALDSLVQSGKVRYIGASNYPAWLLTKSLWVSDVKRLVRFDSLQPHYSLLHRREYERELEPLCVDQGIGVIPYSPLAAGFLTGKYTRENRQPDTTRNNTSIVQQLQNDDAAYDVLDHVRRVADEHGVPMAHVALAWLLARPGMTSPIIGARTVEQLQQVIGATELTLSADDIAALEERTQKY